MRRSRALVSWLCCVLSLFTLASVNAAVMSVDVGSEWLKVAVVDLKPGQSPITIALNEMSKRKSPALVAFHEAQRLVGEEAAGIAARYPEKVYARVRDLAGKPFHSVKQFLKENYLPYDVREDAKSGLPVFSIDNNLNLTSEALLAMILDYGRSLAEAHTKSIVKDAVFSVPPYFGQSERQSLMNAAQVAGISVLSLMNEHSGAALQYGIDKDFSNESRNVLFYDMGSGSVYAAVIHFSSYIAKDRGKNASFNYFQVKGVCWDASLGGQTLDMRLVEYFAKEFNKQIGGGVDVKQFPKAMAKLKKQAKRTKEILSANTEAPFFVDALHDDRDFRSKITRKRFEELCEDLFERASLPLKAVLADVGLSPEELYSVELLGGGTRVPKLQQVLSDSLGNKILERHLDADEATSLGGALHAANLSDGIKLNRKLGMIDGASYGISMKIEALEAVSQEIDNSKAEKLLLVPRLKKLPSKFLRSLKDDKDLKVTVFYDPEHELPPGILSPELAIFTISGVNDVHQKYAFYNLSAPIKTNLQFSLSRSGTLTLDKVEAVVEIMEWVDVPVKEISENTTFFPSVISENNSTGEAGGSTNGDEGGSSNSTSEAGLPENGGGRGSSTSEGLANANDGNATEALSDDNAKPLVKKKLRKRTLRLPLNVENMQTTVRNPISEEELLSLRVLMDKLRLVDAQKRETAEAKNKLESYIYATKDKLDSLEDIAKVSTEESREAFRHELLEVEDWLYTDGEEAPATEFEKRLKALETTGDPIFFRLQELTDRPLAVGNSWKYLEEVKRTVDEWESKKPWIGDTAKGDVLKEVDAFKQWLMQKEAEQAEMQGDLQPVLTSEDIYLKVMKLKDLVVRIGRTPKPKPAKPTNNSFYETNNSSSETNQSDPPSDTNEQAEDVFTEKDDNLQQDVGMEELETDKAEVKHDEL